VLFLTRQEVTGLLDVDRLLDGLDEAFRLVSAGRVSAPARTAARAPAGMLLMMPAYVPGFGLAAKQVTLFLDNHERGLPSHLAVIALFDEATGAALAVLDGERITAVRTGGASAVSARLLARPDARVLAILGSGVQATAHLESMSRVREIDEVRIASRTAAHAEALAATDPRARAVGSFEEAVRGADIVCCCTPSAEPVLSFGWLSPGTHVTSVGFNGEGSELDRDTVTEGHLFIESVDAFAAPPAGCTELQGLQRDAATELGLALAGDAAGRRDAREITVYKSMGHASQDVVGARIAYERALEQGLGRRVPL
jgi:ornithine cyclodeaminase/thiomorpholine-carboxylate dehydrogenase